MGSRRSNSSDTLPETKRACCQYFRPNRVSGTRIDPSGQQAVWLDAAVANSALGDDPLWKSGQPLLQNRRSAGHFLASDAGGPYAIVSGNSTGSWQILIRHPWPTLRRISALVTEWSQ
jgi:hypothetical protein